MELIRKLTNGYTYEKEFTKKRDKLFDKIFYSFTVE